MLGYGKKLAVGDLARLGQKLIICIKQSIIQNFGVIFKRILDIMILKIKST